MQPALIGVLAALVTGLLVALVLFAERWEWEHGIEFHLKVPDWGGSIWDKVLVITLVLAMVGALGALVYAIANPTEERFTEFYILGLNGEAKDYPSQLMVGEEGEVVLGIINREGETVAYRVEVRIDGVISSEVGTVTLEHEEQWEGTVGFTSDRAGDKQKVEFLLYGQAESEIYQGLHLLVDVQ